MTDRDRRHLRGPVHTMRTETAEWDDATKSWKPREGYELISFRPDGNASQLESRYETQTSYTAYRYDTAGRLVEIAQWVDAGPKTLMQFHYDASGRPATSFLVAADGVRQQTETYSYDTTGRKARVQFQMFAGLPDDDDVVDESQAWHGFLAAAWNDGKAPSPLVTVIYDATDRPSEVLVHNISHELQYRVTFTRDRDGRLLSGETAFADITTSFPGLEQTLDKASSEDRAQLEATLETVFEKQTFLSRTFTYDGSGRLLEKIEHMGTLMEEVTTFRYDERGALVETTSSHRSHGMNADGPTPELRREQAARYEYQYDSHGNWTERVTSGQSGGAQDFQRGIVDRRAFTYYPG
jgi:YD repeat-containing protein